MDPKEYQRMFELEDHHWWFQSRLLMTEGLLEKYILPHYRESGEDSDSKKKRPRLLDLGCGTGLFLQRRRKDCEGWGIDFSPQALAYCKRRSVNRVALGDAARPPLPDATMDIVTAFDLIEHIPDDKGMIEEIWRVLKPGGYFMATVPAHPSLWTGHDVVLHHQRRYRRKTFEPLFDPEHWETIRMTASFSGIFFPAAIIRLARRVWGDKQETHSDTTPAPEWLNGLMIRLHRLEVAWLLRHDLPVGVSYLTIRRKIG